MVVLSIWGEIEPVDISQKLGLYLSNFDDSRHDDWRPTLEKQLIAGKQALEIASEIDLSSIDRKIETLYKTPVDDGRDWASYVAGKMIFLDQKYRHEDMPLGGWETNCFDARACEEDYSEKLLDFLLNLSQSIFSEFPKNIPVWIYSSNHDEIDYRRLLFWGGKGPAEYIDSLKEWGVYLDNLLQSRNDYLLLDYLVNAYHFDDQRDEYHLLKSYSLCQLFLEKKRELELDYKLPQFIRYFRNDEDRKACAVFLRKIRNKLAHGDFQGLDCLLEKYALRFMQGHFSFDYAEFSRRNWILGHICLVLDSTLLAIMEMLFTDRCKIKKIKEMRLTE